MADHARGLKERFSRIATFKADFARALEGQLSKREFAQESADTKNIMEMPKVLPEVMSDEDRVRQRVRRDRATREIQFMNDDEARTL